MIIKKLYHVEILINNYPLRIVEGIGVFTDHPTKIKEELHF